MNYSMWLLEYANCPTQPISTTFAGKHNAGTMNIPFSYIVIKSEDTIAMVDVGYDYDDIHKEMADKFGCINWQPPEKVLDKIGIHPNDIEKVFITHTHYDHMGNLHSFPNAHFYLQKDEMLEWTWVMSLPKQYSWIRMPLEPHDMVEAMKLIAEERLTLVDGHLNDVLPNIDLHAVPNTHSFSSQLVIVKNDVEPDAQEKWVVAGDCAYSYENLTGASTDGVMYPIGIFVGTPLNVLRSFDQMKEMVHGDLNHIIIGHDDECWERYPSWVTDDGLHVAEICLADGETSKRPMR